MADKTTLEIIKEMTNKIKESMNSLTTITEKRYQYNKEECETIFNNIYKAVEEYTKKDTSGHGYEKLLISISDRFKVGPTGGNVSRQIDSLSTAEFLYENQVKFQELLDNAKDVIVFIENKTDALPDTTVSSVSTEKEVVPAETEEKTEQESK